MLVSLVIALFLSIPNQQTNQNPVTALVIKADIVDCKNNPPVLKKDEVLLPVNIVKKYFDPNLFWDEKLQRVITTSKCKVVKMKLNNNIVSVNNKPYKCSVPAKSIKGTIYIPINFLKDVYGINVKTNRDYNLVTIDYDNSPYKQGIVTQLLSPIRKNSSASSPMVKQLKLNDKLEVFHSYKGWYKVRTEEGLVGFVLAKTVEILPSGSSESNVKLSSMENASTKKVTLAWDQMLNVGSIDKEDGLQILSPTWFYVADENGTVKSKANEESIKSYVKKAHEADKKVWAMFTNSFSPIISSSILNNGLLRDKVISQIAALAETYDLDGINIDFENMREKDKAMFTQFIRELAPILRDKGRTISVDIAAPTTGWICYDAKALAETADYINLMTYDQHWRTCPYSGSVAQYTWVEDKLGKTLEEVPPEKLLLGIPFYTRGWKEEFASSGSTKVTQYKVFSMNGARSEVKTNNADIQWDDESGQYYAQYIKDNAIYKIWLENDDSINLKTSLVHKYNLAGVAIWEKSFADQNVWKILKRNLYQNKSYADWIKYNKKTYKRMKNNLYCKH